MSRTLLWKEWREYAPTMLALALLSAFTLGSIWYWVEPAGVVQAGSSKAAGLLLAAVLLAGVHGIISGALPLAGELEAGTLPFLDVLTARRLVLWRVKLAGITVLVLAHALWLKVCLHWLGQSASASFWWQQDGGSLLILAAIELLGLAWGLFASALCRTVLAASALAAFLLISTVVPAQTLVTQVLPDPSDSTALIGLLLLEVVLATPAVVGSWWFFCRSDWRRATWASGENTASWKSLFWLNWSQARPQFAWLLLGTFCVVALVGWSGAALWPVATAALGLFCGIMAFASDHEEESYRFLGEQRLPAGRMWLVKITFWLGLAMLFGLIPLAFDASMLARAAARSHSETPNGSIAIDLTLFNSFGWFSFLAFWMLYSFSVAQFVAILVRKGGVALFLAAFGAVGLIIFWLPSLIMGGVSSLVLLVAPLWLLLTTRLAFWNWTSGRLWSVRCLAGMIAAALLVVAWTAAFLWHRAQQIPDIGEPFDRQAYIAGLTEAEKRESARLLRQSANELNERIREVTGDNASWPRLLEGNPQNEYLDRVFRGVWLEHLQQAIALPPGLNHDPRPSRLFESSGEPFAPMLQMLSLRAMQLQARQDLRGAVDLLLLKLQLIRHLQHHASFAAFFNLGQHQQETLKLLDGWRLAATSRPELLRHALSRLADSEKQKASLSDSIKASYLSFLNTLDAPVTHRGGPLDALERSMIADVLRQAPWERERFLRLMKLYFAGWIKSAETDWWGLDRPISDNWARLWVSPAGTISLEKMNALLRDARAVAHLAPFFDGLRLHEMATLKQWRTLQLNLAVDLHRNDHQGARPKDVNELTPGYLAEPLIDPETGEAMSWPSKR